jgi:hypothetical protein
MPLPSGNIKMHSQQSVIMSSNNTVAETAFDNPNVETQTQALVAMYLNDQDAATSAIDKIEKKPQGTIMAKPKLGFLDLPGEIRNSIYSLLAEDSACEARRPMRHQASRGDSGSEDDQVKWSRDSRQDLGFTQTCRQIQHEYGPIHTQHTRKYVSLGDLALYAKTVDNDTSILNLPSVRLRLGLESQVPSREPGIDIVPLIHLIKRHRCLLRVARTTLPRSAARDPDPELRAVAEQIRRLLDVCDNDVWYANFREKIKSIIYYSNAKGFETRAIIFVKTEHQEKWMRKPRGSAQWEMGFLRG